VLRRSRGVLNNATAQIEKGRHLSTTNITPGGGWNPFAGPFDPDGVEIDYPPPPSQLEELQRQVLSNATKQEVRPRRAPAKNVGDPYTNVMRWRHYILSDDGPSDRMTRFILLVIGAHMNVQTGIAWPSYKTIAKEALVSERCAIKHVGYAVKEGFLIRWHVQRAGGYDHNRYQSAVPPDFCHPALSVAERIERFGPKG
jgi:hypothetical protein